MRRFRRILVTAALVLLFTLLCAAAYAEGATLKLPDTLTEIEDQAFYGDTSLENVVPPRGIQKIGAQAFANSSVKIIALPENVDIADDAFAGTHLQRLVTPGGGATGRWAEGKGIPVAYNNSLRLYPRDGWNIFVAPGAKAELAIDHYDIAWDYNAAAHLDWYRISTDANGKETRTNLNKHDMTLTTGAINGPVEYVCRITDYFGFKYEGRFHVDSCSVSAQSTEVGSTWASFDLTYSSTLQSGYCVGLAFSQKRSDVEQLNDRNRFDGDNWRWDELFSAASGEHIGRHVDQLIPDKTYYFRPIITVNKEVVAYGDIIELHTPAAKTAGVGEPEDDVDLITMRPYKEIKFSGDEVLPVIFTSKEENGFHVLNFSRPVGQADIRTADGKYYLDGKNTESLTFYAEKGVPLYFFLRNWDEEASATLSDAFTPAPTADSIDASDIYFSEADGAWYVDVNVTITPETAAKGYSYLVEISPVADFSRINQLFRQGGDYKVRLNEVDTRPVPPLVPGSKLYYRAAIWGADGAYTGPTHVFTVPDWDVPALTLNADWTYLQENTPFLYKFTPAEPGFYGVDTEGMYELALLGPDGSPMRGINKIELDTRKAFILMGFEEGDTLYIRANGDRNPRIRMVPEGDRGITLNENPQWMWDARLTRCVVPTTGNYTVTVNRADLAGNMHLYRGLDPVGPVSFNGGTTATVSLTAGEIYHFIAWYDMSPGNELYTSVSPVN